MFNCLKFVVAILFFLTFSLISYAQISPKPLPATDTIREFEIIRAPSMRAIKIDSITTLQTVAGGAIIKQEGTIFHSDSAVLNPTTHEIEAFGHIHINQGDTIHTYGDYLKYLGVEKMAYLTGNVKLTDGKGTLFTKDLDYNIETGIGNFYKGGRVVEKKNVITSLEGTYYADTKDVYFKKNVVVQGPKDTITADSLLYNMQTKKSNFISQTHIKNAEVDINTTEGSYDLNTGDAFFTQRTTVKDSSGRIYSADNMALVGLSGDGQLEGNAVIIDSANSFVIIANQIFLNKKNNSFLATRKPLLIIQQKNDSTYIAADTIFSGLKGSKMILQKDTVLNINVQQNEKIGQLIETDTGNPRDSANRRKDSLSLHNDSTLLNPRMKEFIKGLPDSLHKDSAKIKIPPNIIARMPVKIEKDTSIIEMAQKFRKPKSVDSLTPAEKALTDSLIQPKNIDTLLTKIPGDTSVRGIVKSPSTGKMQDSTLKNAKSKKDSSLKSDSSRYFLAFHNVRIFNDSLQSVCDSLFFSTEDSVFRLYKDPVIWNGQSQITGDTVYLFTKNKEPERLYVFENGMMINRTKEGFFNQIAGKTINAYFLNGHIDYARVRGQQSESIHYMQDEDSAYIGMNRATGDVIDFYFRKDELIKVLFINDIKGHMYPMNDVPDAERELRNFKWLDKRRPKNKFELYD
jgi:lipopolysaccharide export system protein LptA